MPQQSKTVLSKTIRDWLDAMSDTTFLETICEPFEPTRGAPATLALADLIRPSAFLRRSPRRYTSHARY